MHDSTPTLDSKVFFSIPQPEMGTDDYRHWVESELIPEWIVKKEGNKASACHDIGGWNIEGGIFAKFGGNTKWCKLYKIDGTGSSFGWLGRGLLIRDHYTPDDAEKIKLISNSLEESLKEQKVPYARQDFYHS